MVDFTRVWNWYSRGSVQLALIEAARGREVAPIYRDGNFGKRPNMVNYQGDVLQMVAEGAVSFHASVEQWSNPMKLEPGMQKEAQDEIRTGWDIFIDPDVPDFEIAKITVKNVVEALKDHGVVNYSIKFSGGKSFHIGIPFKSLPERLNMADTARMYPDMMQKVIEFLKFYMRDKMKESLDSIGPANVISQRVNKPVADITDANGTDPFKVVNMDIFSSRHLFRLPYSLHEKSLLVSLPLKYERLDQFEKEMAAPEKVKVDEKFLQQRVPTRDAEALVIEALDWSAKNKVEVVQEVQPKQRQDQQRMRYISEDMFPPCIRHMLDKGLGDGKKRAIFVLINFLRNMGWSQEQIEKKLDEWNARNVPSIRTNYLRGQVKWHFRSEKPMLPPNCDNENYYKPMGVHCLCEQLHQAGVKNPVSFPFRMLRAKSQAKKDAKFKAEREKRSAVRRQRQGS